MYNDLLKAQNEWSSQLVSQADRTDPNKEMVIISRFISLSYC